MSAEAIYYEKVTSRRTTLFFATLSILLLVFSAWRVVSGRLDTLAVILLLFALVFLFYTINYRTLIIHLAAGALKLTFGIFTWEIPLENISRCQPDEGLPFLMEYGGAGIHFMFVRKRYRASFNFLEHPRVVVELRKKVGPVRDISFSTRRPEELVRQVREAVSKRRQP